MKNKRSRFKTFIKFVKFSMGFFIMFFKTFYILFRKLYGWLLKRLYFSISFKITTVYTVLFAFILFLFNIALGAAFIYYLGENAKDNMLKDFKIISSNLQDNAEIPAGSLDQLAQIKGVVITIFNENHQVIYTSQTGDTPAFHEKENNIPLNDNFFLLNNSKDIPGNPPYHSPGFGFNLVLNDQTLWNFDKVYIQITNSLQKETLSAGLLMAALFIITMIVIVIVLFIGSRASKRMLSPVEKMTNTVKKITVNALDTRLDVGGSQDELKELAKTFNSMLDRIQTSYEQQNQFVSDASHELRTPIAVIQGYANLLDRWGKNEPAVLEESIQSIKAEANNMKDLIEKLLFLARGDKDTQRIVVEEFSIGELVHEVIRETKLIDEAHEIVSNRSEGLLIKADRELIKEALRIFIDNSIKFTPPGGRIAINCYSQNHKVYITVEDTGAGISKEDVPYIFNRFYRADKSRTKQTGGTGLGLAIARWIILKHKGTIEVESKINEGTKIIVTMPV